MLRSGGCCRSVWLSQLSCSPLGSQELPPSELQGKISHRRERKKKTPPQILPKSGICETYQVLHAKLFHVPFVKELCSTSVIRRKTVTFCWGRDRVIFTSAILPVLWKYAQFCGNAETPCTLVHISSVGTCQFSLSICGHVKHDVTVSQLPSCEIRIAVMALPCKRDEFSLGLSLT